MLKKIAVILVFACLPSFPTFAQAPDAPPTAEEQQILQSYRKQAKAQGLPAMTPEEEAMMLRKSRELRSNMTLGILNLQQLGKSQLVQRASPATLPNPASPAETPPAVSTMTMSKSELAAAISTLSIPGPFVMFARRRDGFTINGTPYLDPDGAIVDFGADGVTGAVTYIVDMGNGAADVKYLNAHSDLPALRIGTLTNHSGRVKFLSVAGDTAGGDTTKPTSRGLVILRTGSVVNYDLMQGTKAVPVPDNFHVAKIQNGDVGATRYILIERDTERKSDSAKLLSDTGKLFGSVFGKEKSYDYGLLNVDSGQVVALNMALSGKQVGHGTGCQSRNAFVNQCSGWKTYDAIYEPNGRPNYSHYYWSLQWQNTVHGPVATVIENGLKEVNVIRLSDGVRFNAFNRGMGIQYFDTEPLANGSLKLVAYWAFKGHPVEDISTLFSSGAGGARATE